MTWRYRTDKLTHVCAPELVGVVFANEWITIEFGAIRIEKGYAWDGCSPSYRLPGDVWIGVWDGPVSADGWPVSWLASLVHDALCQYRELIPGLKKHATVALFRRLLAEAGAPGWMVLAYPAAVDLFGPQHWNGDV